MRDDSRRNTIRRRTVARMRLERTRDSPIKQEGRAVDMGPSNPEPNHCQRTPDPNQRRDVVGSQLNSTPPGRAGGHHPREAPQQSTRIADFNMDQGGSLRRQE